MHYELDLKNWNRRSHFEFFQSFEDPFFNLTAQVDVTHLYHARNRADITFFLASLYCSMHACNRVDAFRYRIREDQVIVHDKIHIGSTILHDDNTFGFCYFPYTNNLLDFCSMGRQNIQTVLDSRSFEAKDHEDALTHHSVIPWVSFSQIKHPRKFIKGDSIPKIVFGKYFTQGDRVLMPISVEAHHGLMDGFHVSAYFEEMQSMLDSKEIIDGHKVEA